MGAGKIGRTSETETTRCDCCSSTSSTRRPPGILLAVVETGARLVVMVVVVVFAIRAGEVEGVPEEEVAVAAESIMNIDDIPRRRVR